MSAPAAGDWPDDEPVDLTLVDPGPVDDALVDERIAAAVLKEADAAGAVLVAVAQLSDLQESGDATPSKIVAAEQKLASKERHHQAARDAVARARQRVAEEAHRADAPAEPETPALQFTTLPAFVAFFTELYRRDVFDTPDRVWCPEWWQHPEALARLEAIWRSYEALRHEPGTGMSVWLLVHVDPHMSQLLAPHGPFRGCHAKRGHATSPLAPFPLAEPPADWWPEEHSGL
ncbi:DUF4913 domain-containing protein [Modestobacter sp. SSW1-42]|uniref:DUF4913 domain-containing protein n=1 Tax=Modestobacter sp. SSW1-42 TaxID=596372 RepID=UPI00398577E7